jgi:flagellar biogenesis protein FliO
MLHLINFILLGAGMAPDAPEVPLDVNSGVHPIDMVPGYEGAFLKMFLALIGLIVGIFLTVWLLKKIGQGRWTGGGNKSIKIVEKRPLSPKTMLYVIDVDGHQSVIAESQLEVKHLITLEKELPNR